MIFTLVCMYIHKSHHFRFNVNLGIGFDVGGVGPRCGVNYENTGRKKSLKKLNETFDLGLHNDTKVYMPS